MNIDWAGLARVLSGIGLGGLLCITDYANVFSITVLAILILSNALLVAISPFSISRFADIGK